MTDAENDSTASAGRRSSPLTATTATDYVARPSALRRGAQVLVAVVVVAAIAVTALVIYDSRTPASPGAAPQIASSVDSSSAAGTATRSMLYIGDSYTAGPTGQPEFGYTCLTANALGDNCNISAIAGTGYINGGPGHRLPNVPGASNVPSTSLPERLPELREKYSADIIVLDAGRNDLPYGPEALTNALLYTVGLAQQTWRGAQIVVIAPWFIFRPRIAVPTGNGSTTPVGDYISSRMRKLPQFDDVIFIDPARLGWFAGESTKPITDPDGIHPTVQGYQQTARLLAGALLAASGRRAQ